MSSKQAFIIIALLFILIANFFPVVACILFLPLLYLFLPDFTVFILGGIKKGLICIVCFPFLLVWWCIIVPAVHFLAFASVSRIIFSIVLLFIGTATAAICQDVFNLTSLTLGRIIFSLTFLQIILFCIFQKKVHAFFDKIYNEIDPYAPNYPY